MWIPLNRWRQSAPMYKWIFCQTVNFWVRNRVYFWSRHFVLNQSLDGKTHRIISSWSYDLSIWRCPARRSRSKLGSIFANAEQVRQNLGCFSLGYWVIADMTENMFDNNKNITKLAGKLPCNVNLTLSYRKLQGFDSKLNEKTALMKDQRQLIFPYHYLKIVLKCWCSLRQVRWHPVASP